MLSADIQSIELLKRSYSLVKRHSKEIGERTYSHLFNEHPEIKKLFSNTSPGQAQRLMDTILFYCEEPENYSTFYEKLDHIAQIHLVVGIKNEYYGYMKDAFICALKEVLTTEADTKFIRAWAYGFDSLSNELMHIENLIRKYKQREH
jgi:hemoglobin-like flavoprotein